MLDIDYMKFVPKTQNNIEFIRTSSTTNCGVYTLSMARTLCEISKNTAQWSVTEHSDTPLSFDIVSWQYSEFLLKTLREIFRSIESYAIRQFVDAYIRFFA